MAARNSGAGAEARPYRVGGRWKLLLFCWLGWVCDFYTLILYSFLMPSISRDLHFDDRDQAWIQGISLLGTALGGVIFGRVADRWGRAWGFSLSVGFYSIGSGLCGFAQGFWSMLLLRFWTGIGVGGEWGIGHAMAAENVPLQMRGRVSGLLQSGGPSAMALAAIVGSFLAPQIGWRETFFLSTVPILLALSAPYVFSHFRSKPEKQQSARALFQGNLLRPSLAMFFLLAMNMAAFWCTYSFLPKYLQTDLSKPPEFVGRFQLVLSFGHILGNLSFGWFADRFPRPRVFTIYSLFFAGGVFAIALWLPVLSENSWFLLGAMATVGLGAGNWSCFGALFADHFPPEVRGTASSGFYSVSRGIQFLTQLAVVNFALLMNIPTGRSGLFFGAMFSAIAAGSVWLLPHRERSGLSKTP